MSLKERILALIYPRRATCIGCGIRIGLDEDDLCEACAAELIRNRIGPTPVPKGIDADGMAFAHPYRGPGGAMVRTLKYASVHEIAPRMGEDIANVIEDLRIRRPDLITFVPMPTKRQRRRGFNQSELLARETGALMGIRCENTLRRAGNAKQQARLSRKQREQNLKNGFEAIRSLEGMNIVLIDDVMTTGATAKYCISALRKAGAAQVYFAAYAMSARFK